MTHPLLALAVGLVLGMVNPSAADVSLFAMDTGTSDATHRTPAEQAALAKETGFGGVGPTYHHPADFQAWVAAADANGLKLNAVYLPLRLDDVAGTVSNVTVVAKAAEGRDTLIWLPVMDKPGPPSGTNGDALAIAALRDIADVAKQAGLRVALYPHAGFRVERVEQAVRLAEAAGRDNVGVTFNLCHWLKVDGRDLDATLNAAGARLVCVTVSGADTGGTEWSQLIQPLDAGTYDVAPLLRSLRRMNYTGPVGLQHYGIRGDARENLSRSQRGWKKLTAAATAAGP
jgi:sugar phosphate isomerase/epimerase